MNIIKGIFGKRNKERVTTITTKRSRKRNIDDDGGGVKS